MDDKITKSEISQAEDLSEVIRDLAKEKSQLEAILDSVGDGIVVMDKDGKIIRTNKTFKELLGWKGEDVLGRYMAEIIPKEDEDGNRVLFKDRVLSRVLAGEKVSTNISHPYYFVRKDGSKFPVSLIVTPIKIDDKIQGAVEAFRDITKDKEIDKAKTEFVSLASHQLRTPLSAIKWYTEILMESKRGTLNDDQRKYLRRIKDGGERMIDLVEALLNVSRLELGTFTVDTKQTNILQLTRSVMDELKLQIDNKDIMLGIETEDTPSIEADPNLVRIMLSNIIHNAVKYTPEKGKVNIKIYTVKSGEAIDNSKALEDSIVVSVSDTGYGIPKNQQKDIFTKLFRADNVKEHETEGTGLGLYIVKLILDKCGGNIYFESVENKGTTFYMTLPLSGMKRKEGTKKLS